MTIIGLNTKLNPALGGFDVLLGDGITVVSSNLIDLQARIGDYYNTSFTLSTRDGSSLKQYTTEWLSIDDNSIELTYTTLNDYTVRIDVKFSPTRAYNENRILKLIFPEVPEPPLNTPNLVPLLDSEYHDSRRFKWWLSNSFTLSRFSQFSQIWAHTNGYITLGSNYPEDYAGNQIDYDLNTLTELPTSIPDGIFLGARDMACLKFYRGSLNDAGGTTKDVIRMEFSTIKDTSTNAVPDRIITVVIHANRDIELITEDWVQLEGDIYGITYNSVYQPLFTLEPNCKVLITGFEEGYPKLKHYPIGNPIEFNINVCFNLASAYPSGQFIINPSVYDFGDIGDAISMEIPVTITKTSTDSSFSMELLNAIVAAPEFKDADNFRCIRDYSGGNSSTDFLFRLIYHPKYTTQSEVSVQFFYNFYPVGDAILISGSKSNLAPIPYEYITSGVTPSVNNLTTFIAYTNTYPRCIRINDIVIVGDTLNEFNITDLELLTGYLINPGEVVYIPIEYTKKQSTFNLPKLDIKFLSN